jgi:hypothetical protein
MKFKNLQQIKLKKIKLNKKDLISKKINNLNFIKIELFKLKFLLDNKNNLLENLFFYKKNNMNFKSFFNDFLYNKKSTNSLIFLNLFKIFKNIKLLVDFLLYSNKNYLIFYLILKIIPGFFSNWYKKQFLFLYPHSCIYLNSKKDIKLELFFHNELKNLNIFQIIIKNHFNFYEKLNYFDFFIPLNIQNNKKNFLIFINFINKINKILKIFFCYFEQKLFKILLLKKIKLLNNKILNNIKYKKIKKDIFFLLNSFNILNIENKNFRRYNKKKFYILKNKKLNNNNNFFYNKITHYWTRTNTLKKRTDFKSVMSTNSIK